MTEEALEDIENDGYRSFFVPGTFFKDYGHYCPLVSVGGYLDDSGNFVGKYYEEEVIFEPHQLVTDPGFLVIHLMGAERDEMLEAAGNAIYESLYSLFGACNGPVTLERMRTSVEFEAYLSIHRPIYSHIVLIGHGDGGGVTFVDKPGAMRGHQLAGLLGADTTTRPLQIISLCCKSGCVETASALSEAPGVSEVIAPQGYFSTQWAAHFVTGYFLELYTAGKTVEKAVCDAATNKEATPMGVWRKGALAFSCEELKGAQERD